MHDVINTLGGRFGFAAVKPDGAVVYEFHSLWDEVKGPLKALRLVGFDGKVYLELEGYDSYFFSNEAVSVASLSGARIVGLDKPQVVAKLFGGVKGGASDLVRVDLSTGTPRGQPPQHSEKHSFQKKALRKGV